MKTKSLALAALLALSFGTAHAGEPNAAMQAYVDATARAWFTDGAVVAAIEASNAHHAGLSEARLIELDSAWRAEVGQASTPTIAAIHGSAVSAMLRERVAEAGGKVTEIILMDNRGMNVAVSSVTSDFWQGDEAKFTETFPHGPAALHISDIELDESSQTYQAQVSFVVADASGNPIGAVTIGLNAEAF